MTDQFVFIEVEFRLQFLKRPIQYQDFLFAEILVDFGVRLLNSCFVVLKLVKITLLNLVHLILFNHWFLLELSQIAFLEDLLQVWSLLSTRKRASTETVAAGLQRMYRMLTHIRRLWL